MRLKFGNREWQPKTQPRVNPRPNIHMKPQRNWELKLGPIQVMILIGLILGSLIAMYLLGTLSGQSEGFASASALATVSSPRQEIPSVVLGDQAGNEPMPDLYAKLSQVGAKSVANREGNAPKLGVIERGQSGALVPPSSDSEVSGSTVSGSGVLGSAVIEKPVPSSSPASKAVVRMLGDDTPPKPAAGGVSGSTLGSLLEDTSKLKPPSSIDISTKKVPLQDPVSVKTGDKDRAVVAALAAKSTPPSLVREPQVLPTSVPSQTRVVQTPPAVVKPINVKENLAKGWYAQIVAQKSVNDADAIGQILKGSGFSVVIEKADVRGERYYRLLVGPEDSKTEAERLITQLKREKSLRSEPFLRVVK